MPDGIRILRALAKTNHDAGARHKAFWMGQRLWRNTCVGWWDLCTPLPKTNARALVAAPLSRRSNEYISDRQCGPTPNGNLWCNYAQTMFATSLPFRTTKPKPGWINYRIQEVPRWSECHELGTSWCRRNGALIHVRNVKTHHCLTTSWKIKLKRRTRATIGGDHIDYPYSTTAITAELEAITILLNAMISDNAQFTTIDLEDFYLGTSLPFPELIRIPAKFIPKKGHCLLQAETIHPERRAILYCVENPLYMDYHKKGPCLKNDSSTT